MSEELFFIGPGRMGLALGYALWQSEALASLTYCGRRPEPPSHPLFTQGNARYVFGLERPPEGTTAVVLSVPDETLPEIATTLAGQGRAPGGTAAFHLSGALSTDPLAPLHARGYAVGTLHPLQTVAHPITGADLLPGSYFAVSGEPQALSVARRLLHALGGSALQVPVSRRPLYHAAGVFASNYAVAVLQAAVRLLGRAGVDDRQALEAVLALIRGTLKNVEDLGLGSALTGPLARGDVETVHLHLRMLEPRERRLYAELGSELLASLRPGDLDAEMAEQLAELLQHEGRR